LQAKNGALAAALITGVIWGVWHLPKLLNHWDWGYFGLFMLDTTLRSVLLAWIYNGTRGSLLLVVLAHGVWNTTGIFLPTANTLSSEGLGAFGIQVVLELIVAAVIVARTGAANLSRTEQRQVQA
jgi:membrane protease YdiL (CAAX protease family)